MKSKYVYTEQFTLKIDRELKTDLGTLANIGVDVAELVRPALRELVAQTKERLDAEADLPA